MLLFELITGTWSHIQGNLYPWFQAEVGPLTDNHKRLITVLEVVRVEAFVKMHDGVPGRPVEDRQALARALIAKAVHKLPTTRKLMERLHVDTTLRQLCGWECVGELPADKRSKQHWIRLQNPDTAAIHAAFRAVDAPVPSARFAGDHTRQPPAYAQILSAAQYHAWDLLARGLGMRSQANRIMCDCIMTSWENAG